LGEILHHADLAVPFAGEPPAINCPSSPRPPLPRLKQSAVEALRAAPGDGRPERRHRCQRDGVVRDERPDDADAAGVHQAPVAVDGVRGGMQRQAVRLLHNQLDAPGQPAGGGRLLEGELDRLDQIRRDADRPVEQQTDADGIELDAVRGDCHGPLA
jgi:hypothetical protein